MKAARLKNFCSGPPKYGVNLESTAYVDAGLRLLRTTDLTAEGRVSELDGVYVDPTTEAPTLEPDDLLLSRSGTLGRAVRWDGAMGPATFAGYLVRFRPAPESDSRYLAWALQSTSVQDQISAGAVQSTISNFNAERYANLALPWHSLDHQRRIADFLDAETARIDALIEKKRRLTTLVAHRVAGFRDSSLEGCGGARRRLGRFVDSIEQGSSPVASDRPAEQGEWGVLKLSAIKRGEFVPQENKALNEPPAKLSAQVRDGDLLVTRANTPELVGEAGLAHVGSEKLALPDLIYRVNLRHGLDPSYALHSLLSGPVRSQISAAARGSSQSMVKLRGSDIRELEILVPSLEAQTEVARAIDARQLLARSTVTRVAQQIILIRERRQALITAAVTGEFDPASYRSGIEP